MSIIKLEIAIEKCNSEPKQSYSSGDYHNTIWDFAMRAKCSVQKSESELERRERMHKAGFMLIELIIVLFLIVLIVGLSTVFFANSLPSSKFNATVREIAANIRYAKTSANIKGENQIFYIDFDSRQYGIDGVILKNIPPNINVKAVDPFLGDVYKGRYQVLFYASGGLEGGTIILSDNKRTATIYLDPVVGSIVVK